MITAATNRTPYVVGKPNPMMFRSAMRRIEAHSESTAMIGDRMDTDIVAGMEAGLLTALVLTGVTTADDVETYPFRPDLILADIQLADGSSGIDAVNELLADMGELPVIFITAFPERLLTGDRPEPAFLISKPYSEEQVRSAVSQAMFFASTEGLTVS